MNLHNEIINIEVSPKDKDAFTDSGGVHRTYLLGHRDARHAAAELSLDAEILIEDLELRIKTLEKENKQLNEKIIEMGA